MSLLVPSLLVILNAMVKIKGCASNTNLPNVSVCVCSLVYKLKPLMIFKRFAESHHEHSVISPHMRSCRQGRHDIQHVLTHCVTYKLNKTNRLWFIL